MGGLQRFKSCNSLLNTVTCSTLWDTRNLGANKQVIAGKMCIIADFVLEVN